MTPLDPDQTFKFALPDDPTKVVICRYGSRRGWSAFKAGVDSAMELPEATYMDALLKVLNTMVVGCEGCADLEDLPEGALFYLAYRLPRQARLDYIEKKESAWQSRTSSDGSAKAATQDGA